VVKGDRLESPHQISIPTEILMKKEQAKDMHLMFTDLVTVSFVEKGGSISLVNGQWCNPCR